MGISFSCPLSDFDDVDSHFQAILVTSFSIGGRDMKRPLRSVSFNSCGLEPNMMKSYGSGKMIFEGSLSLKGRELETTLSFRTPAEMEKNSVFGRCVSAKDGDIRDHLARSHSLSEKHSATPLLEPGKHRNLAALRLQKVYKSFRTRRQLADCAVLVEQSWWKLLDFAELKRSSISFFDIEKNETAVSRWSRARTKAAKLGKGLSKDEKARKLALQHWLEAIDPRHRYGHNLQFYYVKWRHCESKQPFFYWLDIGEGKEVSIERCSRSKLQQQCIKYLCPAERKAYEVVLKNGKFVYKQSGTILDTTRGPKDAKWIFVLSTSKTLYVGLKNKGKFQHSSFLAGGATLSAGRLVVEDGILEAVWPHSGHYLPTEENFQEFMLFLKGQNVDLTNVKTVPSEEEDEFFIKNGNDICFQNKASEADLSQETTNQRFLAQEFTDSRNWDSNVAEDPKLSISRLSQEVGSKMSRLKIPNRHDAFDENEEEEEEEEEFQPTYHTQALDSSSEDGYETAEESFLLDEDFMVSKPNLFDEYEEEDDEQPIPKEKIMQRIDSHKGIRSFQLAGQLTSKWATGAGPRIGCMRDYPSELQFRVLEHANLSPRSTNVAASPRNLSRFQRF